MTAVLAMAGAALAASAGAGAAAAPPPAHTALAALTGKITGKITGGDAVSVRLYAWPNDLALRRVTTGAPVPRALLATARSSGGRYSLDPDLGRVGANYTQHDGSVNVEVDVEGTVWSTTARPGQAQVADFDVRNGTVAANGHGAARSGTGGAYGPKWSCSDWVGGGYVYSRPEAFMYAYGRPHAPATVTQRVGSSHSLGAAISVNGGSWNTSTSATIEKHVEAGGTKTYSYPYKIANRVNYRHWYRTCTPPSGQQVYDWVKPYNFADFLSDAWAAGSPDSFTTCVYKDSGTWWKSHGSNWTFSAGVDLFSDLSLSAQVGYSADTEISWHVTGAVRLCGSTSLGWVDSPVAAARKLPPSPPDCRPGHPCAVRD